MRRVWDGGVRGVMLMVFLDLAFPVPQPKILLVILGLLVYTISTSINYLQTQ